MRKTTSNNHTLIRFLSIIIISLMILQLAAPYEEIFNTPGPVDRVSSLDYDFLRNNIPIAIEVLRDYARLRLLLDIFNNPQNLGFILDIPSVGDIFEDIKDAREFLRLLNEKYGFSGELNKALSESMFLEDVANDIRSRLKEINALESQARPFIDNLDRSIRDSLSTMNQYGYEMINIMDSYRNNIDPDLATIKWDRIIDLLVRQSIVTPEEADALRKLNTKVHNSLKYRILGPDGKPIWRFKELREGAESFALFNNIFFETGTSTIDPELIEDPILRNIITSGKYRDISFFLQISTNELNSINALDAYQITGQTSAEIRSRFPSFANAYESYKTDIDRLINYLDSTLRDEIYGYSGDALKRFNSRIEFLQDIRNIGDEYATGQTVIKLLNNLDSFMGEIQGDFDFARSDFASMLATVISEKNVVDAKAAGLIDRIQDLDELRSQQLTSRINLDIGWSEGVSQTLLLWSILNDVNAYYKGEISTIEFAGKTAMNFLDFAQSGVGNAIASKIVNLPNMFPENSFFRIAAKWFASGVTSTVTSGAVKAATWVGTTADIGISLWGAISEYKGTQISQGVKRSLIYENIISSGGVLNPYGEAASLNSVLFPKYSNNPILNTVYSVQRDQYIIRAYADAYYNGDYWGALQDLYRFSSIVESHNKITQTLRANPEAAKSVKILYVDGLDPNMQNPRVLNARDYNYIAATFRDPSGREVTLFFKTAKDYWDYSRTYNRLSQVNINSADVLSPKMVDNRLEFSGAENIQNINGLDLNLLTVVAQWDRLRYLDDVQRSNLLSDKVINVDGVTIRINGLTLSQLRNIMNNIVISQREVTEAFINQLLDQLKNDKLFRAFLKEVEEKYKDALAKEIAKEVEKQIKSEIGSGPPERRNDRPDETLDVSWIYRSDKKSYLDLLLSYSARTLDKSKYYNNFLATKLALERYPELRDAVNTLLSPEGLYIQYKVMNTILRDFPAIINRIPSNLIEFSFDDAAISFKVDLDQFGIPQIVIPGESNASNVIEVIAVLEPLSVYRRYPDLLRMFIESYLESYPDLWRAPDVAVYYAGAYKQVVDMLAQAGIPSVLIDDTFPVTELLNYKLIIFPSGSLAYKPDMTNFNAYVRFGGKILVLDQQRGDDYKILPRGFEIEAFGWDQDQACLFRAAYATSNSTLIGGLRWDRLPDLNIDGYFSKLPEGAEIHLVKSTTGAPALASYRFGNGTVVVATLYLDYAKMMHQGTRDEYILFIGMVESLIRDTVEIPEGGSVQLSINNVFTYPITKVKVKLFRAGELVAVRDVNVNIPPVSSSTISVDLTGVEPGIYRVFVELYNSSSTSPSFINTGQPNIRVVPSEYVQLPNKLFISIASEAEVYPLGGVARVIVEVFNYKNVDVSARVVVGTFLEEKTFSVNVPAGGKVTRYVDIKLPTYGRGISVIGSVYVDGRLEARSFKVVLYAKPTIPTLIEVFEGRAGTVSGRVLLVNQHETEIDYLARVILLNNYGDIVSTYQELVSIPAGEARTVDFELEVPNPGRYFAVAQIWSRELDVGYASTDIRIYGRSFNVTIDFIDTLGNKIFENGVLELYKDGEFLNLSVVNGIVNATLEEGIYIAIPKFEGYQRIISRISISINSTNATIILPSAQSQNSATLIVEVVDESGVRSSGLYQVAIGNNVYALKDGSVRIWLPAGTHDVSIQTLDGAELHSFSVTLQAGDEVKVVKLVSSSRISVYVYNPITGQPIEGAVVNVGGESAVTNSSGYAALTLSPVSSNVLVVTARNYTSFKALLPPDLRLDLKVPLLPVIGGDLRIRVTDLLTGAPISNADVRVATYMLIPSRDLEGDDLAVWIDGKRLNPYYYTMSAGKNYIQPMFLPAVNGSIIEARAVNVRDTKTVEFTLTLRNIYTGEEIEFLNSSIRNAAPGEVYASNILRITWDPGFSIESINLGSGEYLFRNLPVGVHYIVIDADGYFQTVATATVVPNRSLEINVTLDKIPSRVVAKVVDIETGQPVSGVSLALANAELIIRSSKKELDAAIEILGKTYYRFGIDNRNTSIPIYIEPGDRIVVKAKYRWINNDNATVNVVLRNLYSGEEWKLADNVDVASTPPYTEFGWVILANTTVDSRMAYTPYSFTSVATDSSGVGYIDISGSPIYHGISWIAIAYRNGYNPGFQVISQYIDVEGFNALLYIDKLVSESSVGIDVRDYITGSGLSNVSISLANILLSSDPKGFSRVRFSGLLLLMINGKIVAKYEATSSTKEIPPIFLSLKDGDTLTIALESNGLVEAYISDLYVINRYTGSNIKVANETTYTSLDPKNPSLLLIRNITASGDLSYTGQNPGSSTQLQAGKYLFKINAEKFHMASKIHPHIALPIVVSSEGYTAYTLIMDSSNLRKAGSEGYLLNSTVHLLNIYTEVEGLIANYSGASVRLIPGGPIGVVDTIMNGTTFRAKVIASQGLVIELQNNERYNAPAFNVKTQKLPIINADPTPSSRVNLTIEVLDPQGNSIPSVAVYINRYYRGATDSQGILVVRGVLVGEYRITLAKTGYETIDFGLSVTRPVTVRAILFENTAKLRIKVLDAETLQPLPSVSVYVNNYYTGATSSPDGAHIIERFLIFPRITLSKSNYQVKELIVNPIPGMVVESQTLLLRSYGDLYIRTTDLLSRSALSSAGLYVNNYYNGATDVNGQIAKSLSIGDYNIILSRTSYQIRSFDMYIYSGIKYNASINMVFGYGDLRLEARDLLTNDVMSSVGLYVNNYYNGATNVDGKITKSLQVNWYSVKLVRTRYYNNEFIAVIYPYRSFTSIAYMKPSIGVINVSTVSLVDSAILSSVGLYINRYYSGSTNANGILVKSIAVGEHAFKFTRSGYRNVEFRGYVGVGTTYITVYMPPAPGRIPVELVFKDLAGKPLNGTVSISGVGTFGFSGSVEFTALSGRSYSISYNAGGISGSRSIYIPPVDRIELLLRVYQAQTGRGDLEVIVLDPQGAPLRGVSVSISQGSTNITRTTNSNGRVLFRDIDSGIYSVVAEARNYEPSSAIIPVIGGTRSTLIITMKPIAPIGPAVISIGLPKNLTVNAGDVLRIPVTLRNDGGEVGVANLRIEVPGSIETVFESVIAIPPGGMVKRDFEFTIEKYLDSREAIISVILNGEEYNIPLKIRGVDLNVTVEVPDRAFSIGESVDVMVSINNTGGVSLNLRVVAQMGTTLDEDVVYVEPGRTVVTTLTVRAMFNESVKLNVRVDSIETGKNIYMNAFYLSRQIDGLSFKRSSQVLSAGEAGWIELTSSSFEEVEVVLPQELGGSKVMLTLSPGTPSRVSFTVDPVVKTGTYIITVVRPNGSVIEIPVDVKGLNIRVKRAGLDSLQIQDQSNATFILETFTDTPFRGFIEVFVRDEDGNVIGTSRINAEFKGLQLFKLKLSIDAVKPGRHYVSYRVIATERISTGSPLIRGASSHTSNNPGGSPAQMLTVANDLAPFYVPSVTEPPNILNETITTTQSEATIILVLDKPSTIGNYTLVGGPGVVSVVDGSEVVRIEITDVDPGTSYVLRLEINGLNAGNTTKEIRFTTKQAVTEYRFRVSELNSFIATVSNTSVNHSFTIENLGNATDTFQIQILVGPGTLSASTVTLDPGQSIEINLTVRAGPPGTVYITRVAIASLDSGKSAAFNAITASVSPSDKAVTAFAPGAREVKEVLPGVQVQAVNLQQPLRLEVYNLTTDPTDTPLPAGAVRVGVVIDVVVNTSAFSYIWINTSYTGINLGNIDESTLKLYRWNTTTASWEPFRETGVDTSRKVVWARAYPDELKGTLVTLGGSPAAKPPAGPGPAPIVGGELEIPAQRYIEENKYTEYIYGLTLAIAASLAIAILVRSRYRK